MIPFLAAIPLRVWLIAAAVAALGGLLWHDHHLSKLYKAERAERQLVEGKLAAKEREMQQQQAASNDYQNGLESLDLARADTPTRDVRLCVTPLVVPSATGGHRQTRPERLPEAPRPDPAAGLEPGRNIGPELYELADEADRCAVQRDALIKWVTTTSGG